MPPIRSIQRCAAACAAACAGLLAAFALLLPGAARAQVADASFAEIAQSSHLIVVGTVEAAESRYTDSGGLIETHARLVDPRVVHDGGGVQADGTTIGVSYLGGRVDSVALEVTHSPALEPGREYVLFKRDDGAEYVNPLVGGARGLFRVMRDTETGTPYVLSASGHAVLSATAEQVRTSDRPVDAIQNGDVAWAEDTTAALEHTALPAAEQEGTAVQLHEDAGPALGTPMTLDAFVDFVQTTALTAPVDDPVLRFEGKGMLYTRRDGGIRREPLPEPKSLGINQDLGVGGATVQGAGQAPVPGPDAGGPVSRAQALRACGFQNLRITMEHHAPTKSRNAEAMNTWNRFMGIYNTAPDDGSFGHQAFSPVNEFAGFASNSRLQSAYGKKWGGSLAKTFIWRVFGTKKCRRLKETDVIVNAAYNWSNALGPVVDTEDVFSYRFMMMHELGHTWGHQTGNDEKYNYDEPSVMHGGYDQWFVEDGWGIHAPDAHYLRSTYSRQAPVLPITDVGVESYHADEGLKLARARKSASAPHSCGTRTPCAFRPGQTMHINGVTVENMSSSAVPVILRFYLSKDRTITASDRQIASFSWSSFDKEKFQESDYTVTVPFEMRSDPGTYHVGARVIAAGRQDDFTRNNATFLYKEVEMKAAHTVSGRIEDRSGTALENVQVARIPQGAATAAQTVKTGASGTYALPVPHGFSGTVEPQSLVFSFQPADLSLSTVTGSRAQDFAATRGTATVSGTVTDGATGAAIGGVTIDGLGVTTTGTGTYEATVDKGRDYDLTPRKNGFTFAPSAHSFDNLTGDRTQDFAGTRAALAASGWPQFQSSRTRSGRRAGAGIATAGTVQAKDVGSNVTAAPAFGAGGATYVGTENGYVYALDARLNRKWVHYLGPGVRATPAVAAGGDLYVAGDGRLERIDPGGNRVWSRSVPVETSPVIGYEGAVYVGADDSLYAYASGGARRWAAPTGGGATAPALGPDSNRVYVGSADGTLYAFDTAGTRQWAVDVGSAVGASPAVGDSTVYVGAEDGRLTAVDTAGTVRWRYQTGGAIEAAPALGLGGRVYVGSTGDALHAVGAAGAKAWSFSTGGDVTAPAVHVYEDAAGTSQGEIVYVGSGDGSVYAVQGQRATGFEPPVGSPLWSHATGGAVTTSPALGVRHLVIGSADDNVYSIRGDAAERVSKTQLVAAAMAPDPGTIYVLNRVARLGAGIVDRFGDSGWAGAGGCGGGPLILPACGAPGARFGAGTGYRDAIAGKPLRFGALAPWVPQEQGSLDAILSGEATAGLLGDVVHQFEPGQTSLAVLAGFSSPSEYPSNPDGRPTALNLFVKQGALARSPDPERVQVMAGHFVPDAPEMEISIGAFEEPLAVLKYGDMGAYRSLPPGRYVVTVRPAEGAASLARGAKAGGGAGYRFRVDLSGQAGQAVALLASGTRADTGEPPLSVRALDGRGRMRDLGDLEGALAPGLSTVPGLLEDGLLLAPGQTRPVAFDPQVGTMGRTATPRDAAQLLPAVSTAAATLREPVAADFPAAYTVPASVLRFVPDADRSTMRGRALADMPPALADLVEARPALQPTHLGRVEATDATGAVSELWLAMRKKNGYALPVASLLTIEPASGDTRALRTAYRPDIFRLGPRPVAGDRFTAAVAVDVQVRTTDGAYRSVTEFPVMMGAAGRVVRSDRLALGRAGGSLEHLDEPIHLRLDDRVLGTDGQRTPLRDSSFAVLAPGEVTQSLAAVWRARAGADGLVIEQGQVHDVGDPEGLRASASAPIGADGRVSFGETGLDIAFAGVEGSGTVLVERFRGGPAAADGIALETVSSYRWVVEADPGLSIGAQTEVRVDVGAVRGIDEAQQVTVYTRPVPGSGSFEEVPTVFASAAGELVATVDSFSEFVLASDSQPLPVELTRFQGRFQEEDVRLTWRTESERGSAGVEVQRRAHTGASRTGASRGTRAADEARAAGAGWRSVGFVNGAGTTGEPQAYRFTDTAVPYAADSLTYRLKQVDADGDVAVLDSVTVRRAAPDRVRLLGTFPNPARDHAAVRFSIPQKRNVSLRLYDVLGRRVATIKDRAIEAGRKQLELDASGLASGTYFLRLKVGETIRTRRLTVVR
jgi:hypothetical protein